MTNSRSDARHPVRATTFRRGCVLGAALLATLGGAAGVAGARDVVTAHVRHPVPVPARSRKASTPARATLVRFVRPVRTTALRDGASTTPLPAPAARRVGPGAGTTDGNAVVRHGPWWCGRAAWRAPPVDCVV